MLKKHMLSPAGLYSKISANGLFSFENTAVFMLKIAVGLVITSIPFAFLSDNPYPFVTAKVVLFQVIVEMCAAILAALWIFKKQYRPAISPMLISLSVLTLMYVITGFTGADAHKSFWDEPDRKAGLILLIHCYIFFLTIVSLHRHISFAILARLIAGTGLAISLASILQSVHWLPILIPTTSDITLSRIAGTFSNSPFLAAYLLFPLFLGLWLFYFEKNFWWRLLGMSTAFFAITALFLTETRGALIGLYLGFAVLLWFLPPYAENNTIIFKRIRLALLAFVLIFPFLFFLSRDNALWKHIPGFNRLASPSLEKNFDDRVISWQIALSGIKKRPLLGWGWNNYDVVFSKFFNPAEFPQKSHPFVDPGNKPFNVPIEHALGSGIFGITAFFAVWAVFFWEVAKKKRGIGQFVGAFGIAYFIQNLALFETIATLPFVYLAFALAHSPRADEEATNSVPNSGESVNFVFLFLFLAVSLAVAIFIYRPVLTTEHYQYLAEKDAIRSPETSLNQWKKMIETESPYRDLYNVIALDSVRRVLEAGPSWEVVQAASRLEEHIAYLEKKRGITYLLPLARFYNALAIHDHKYANDAERVLRIASGLAPNNPEIQLALAKAKLIGGSEIDAFNELIKTRQKHPYLSHAEVMLAVLHYQIGNPEISGILALENTRKDIRANFRDENMIFGDLMLRAGANEEAAIFYARALESPISPMSLLVAPEQENEMLVTIYWRLALTHYRNKEIDKAVDALKRLYSAFPDANIEIETETDEDKKEFNAVLEKLYL